METFCHGHGHEELEHTDRQTLSNIIEKTLLPKMTGNAHKSVCGFRHVKCRSSYPASVSVSALVDLVWDPMSRRQTARLTDVCHKLKEEYSVFEGEQSKPVKVQLLTF